MKNILVLLISVIPFFAISQDTLKISEVFDFEIGDEFHYTKQENNLYAYHIEKIKILSKGYSPQMDSVIYGTQNFISYGVNNYGIFESDQFNILKYAYSNTFVDQFIFGPDSCGTNDTCIIAVNFDNYCDKESMQIKITSGLIGFEEEINETTYAKGLGVTYSREYWDAGPLDAGPHEVERRMVYFKKGNEECGNPATITNIEEQAFLADITISTTLVQNELNINFNSMDNFSTALNLFDLNGKLLLNQKPTSQNQTIDVSHLTAGTYILVIANEEKIFSNKIVKF